MRPFETVLFLRQHTPIIHFQHDQKGATLRATELKPKLDTFILRRLLNAPEKPKIPDHQLRDHFAQLVQQDHPHWGNWLVGKGQAPHVALDYKVSIEQRGDLERYVISSMPHSNGADPRRERLAKEVHHARYLGQTQYFADNQFLANAQEMKNARLGLMAKDLIEIRISSNVPDLVDQVKAALRPFFCSTTFGTRQSKGFGVFLPDGLTDAELLRHLKEDTTVTAIFKESSNASWSAKLQKIGSNYGLLKRGYSNPMNHNAYQKSQLWRFLCGKEDFAWEKRKIKHFLIQHHPDTFDALKHETDRHRIDSCGGENDDEGSEENYLYVRALLGLAEQFEFVKQNGDRLRIKVADSLEAQPTLKERALDRFKSPIRFIVTADAIHLITTKIDPLLHTYPHPETGAPTARKFTFRVDGEAAPNSFSLSVPTTFDLPRFITQLNAYGKNLK